jgi:hypothetical protein
MVTCCPKRFTQAVGASIADSCAAILLKEYMHYTIPAKDEGEYNSAAEDESEDENDREEPLPFETAEHIVGRDLIEDELAEILKKDTGEQEDRRVVQRPASTSEGLWPAGTSEGLRPASSSDSLGSPADIEMGTHSSTPPGGPHRGGVRRIKQTPMLLPLRRRHTRFGPQRFQVTTILFQRPSVVLEERKAQELLLIGRSRDAAFSIRQILCACNYLIIDRFPL